MRSATARGSRQRSTSTEVRVGRRVEDDETSTGHSSSSGNALAEVDPPEGQRGIWDPLPEETAQFTETGVQVGSPQISRAVPKDPQAPLRKAPPPPQTIWAQAAILELRQLRRENRMLQEIFEPGVLQRDDVATVTELVEAAQGWRHHPKSQPNPKTARLSVLRTEGAVGVDADATLPRPNEAPGISAPPVLVGASDLPHPFSAFPPVKAKPPPVALQQQLQKKPPPPKPPQVVVVQAVAAPIAPMKAFPKQVKPRPPHPPKSAAEWLGGSLSQ
eukprot:s72_g50.t1